MARKIKNEIKNKIERCYLDKAASLTIAGDGSSQSSGKKEEGNDERVHDASVDLLV